MLCEVCQERPATVHVTKIVNGHKTEKNLCEVCAQEQNAVGFVMQPNWMLQNFFAELFNQPMLGKQALGGAGPAYQIRCEKCGFSNAQLSATGKLGCPHCYETFAEKLEPVLRRVHGNTRHTGKIPKRTGGSIELRKKIEQLKRELQAAVSREEYELAAQIRDQLRSLEQQL